MSGIRTIIEWREADEHFIQEHAKGPPVDRPVCDAIFSSTLQDGGTRATYYTRHH